MIPRRRYSWPQDTAILTAGCLWEGAVVRGTGIAAFEAAVADYLAAGGGRPVVASEQSGRNALARVLHALGVPAGSTVLVPAYTLGALHPFLEALGYRVAFADVSPDRPLITPETVAAAWHDGVRCVLVTHLFGQVADTPGIAALAHSRRAVVVEDCAHSLGALLDGRPVGTSGDGAFFSFDFLKPVNAAGGGLAAVHDAGAGERLTATAPLPAEDAAEVLRRLLGGVTEDVLFGGPWLRLPTGLLALEPTRSLVLALDRRTRRDARPGPVVPGRLSNLQSRLAMRQLATLDERLRRRREAARRVLAALDLDDSQLAEASGTRSTAYFVTVRAARGESARALRRRLWLTGVDAGIEGEVADRLGPAARFPAAQDWFTRAVQLPCYEGMEPARLRSLCGVLAEFRGRFVS